MQYGRNVARLFYGQVRVATCPRWSVWPCHILQTCWLISGATMNIPWLWQEASKDVQTNQLMLFLSEHVIGLLNAFGWRDSKVCMGKSCLRNSSYICLLALRFNRYNYMGLPLSPTQNQSHKVIRAMMVDDRFSIYLWDTWTLHCAIPHPIINGICIELSAQGIGIGTISPCILIYDNRK